MKKLFLTAVLVMFISAFAFADEPNFMIEVSNGFAVGINLENAYSLDMRLYGPALGRFGLVVENGGLFSENSAFHFFIAPMFLVINTDKWRLPIAIGFDLMGGQNNFYYGLGGMVAVHYSFAKNFYVGANLGITYAFDNRYDELTGYRTEKVIVEDSLGNPVFADRIVPVFENKSHYGNYIYFKPSLVIGFQL